MNTFIRHKGRGTDRPTDGQTNRQIDNIKPTTLGHKGRGTDRPTDGQTNRQIDNIKPTTLTINVLLK